MSPGRHRLEFLQERRNTLLTWLGNAAFEDHPDLPPARAVAGAQLKLEEVRRGNDPVVLRWAEHRHAETVRQLGRWIVERGPAPENGMPVVIEIREIDAEIAQNKANETTYLK